MDVLLFISGQLSISYVSRLISLLCNYTLYFSIEVFFYSEKDIVLGMNLHEAAKKGLLQTVEYLVGEGASVDEKDEDGMYFNRINFFMTIMLGRFLEFKGIAL